MTSYFVEVKQCPNCECEFTWWSVASCNTIGAFFFTDGFVQGPMYDGGSALLTCPSCGRSHWHDELPTRRSVRDTEYFESRKLKSLPSASDVRDCDYVKLLQQRFWTNKDQERHVRIKAWWVINSAYRHIAILEASSRLSEEEFSRLLIETGVGELREKLVSEFRMPPEQEENLLALLALLDSDVPDEAITKAEILRQLGRFEECHIELKRIRDDRFRASIDTIRSLARSRTRQVGLVIAGD